MIHIPLPSDKKTAAMMHGPWSMMMRPRLFRLMPPLYLLPHAAGAHSPGASPPIYCYFYHFKRPPHIHAHFASNSTPHSGIAKCHNAVNTACLLLSILRLFQEYASRIALIFSHSYVAQTALRLYFFEFLLDIRLLTTLIGAEILPLS